MELVSELGAAFVLGLLTPLGAVCVLPLHVKSDHLSLFIRYLSHRIAQ